MEPTPLCYHILVIHFFKCQYAIASSKSAVIWTGSKSTSLSPFPYLRFLRLQTRTFVFRTCVFHPCISLLEFSRLTFSTLATSYLGFPYFRIPSLLLTFSVLAFSVPPFNILKLLAYFRCGVVSLNLCKEYLNMATFKITLLYSAMTTGSAWPTPCSVAVLFRPDQWCVFCTPSLAMYPHAVSNWIQIWRISRSQLRWGKF